MLTIAVSNGTDSGIEDEVFHQPDTNVVRSQLRRVAAQITRFGAALSGYPGDQIADHIGGSLRGRAKTQVALRDGLPVGLRPRLAQFTAAD